MLVDGPAEEDSDTVSYRRLRDGVAGNAGDAGDAGMPMLRRQATSLPGDKTDFVAKHTSFLLSLESRIQSILLYGVSETLEVGMKRSILPIN